MEVKNAFLQCPQTAPRPAPPHHVTKIHFANLKASPKSNLRAVSGVAKNYPTARPAGFKCLLHG